MTTNEQGLGKKSNNHCNVQYAMSRWHFKLPGAGNRGSHS